ncbi:VWA domain-containing protein [Candidatus Poribacteria bacterium]|nr:VWA domain-containing protein [Candidatus Poribacteria bacterium]
MINISKHLRRSITQKALVFSVVLHLTLAILVFYFAVINQPIPLFQDKIDAEITTIPKPPPTKLPKKHPIQQRKHAEYKPTSNTNVKIAAIVPEMSFQPMAIENAPIETVKPRLEKTNTTPDETIDVSTAVKELREVENGLSKTEAAQPTFGETFGTKRSGEIGTPRKSLRSTLEVPGTMVGEDDTVVSDFGDDTGNKPALPYIPFSSVMKNLATDIAETSDGGPIDVVFVVDASGSMGDNIIAVAEHLTDMIDVYKSSNIDYQLGLTEFSAPQKNNRIKILQLTNNLNQYKQDLYAIVPRGDENALDAVEQTISELRFRPTSKKHLIIVTDEPFTSLKGTKTEDTIALCREFGIYVNVLGNQNNDHKRIASETNGKWHAIPVNQNQNNRQQRIYRPQTPRAIAQSLGRANWNGVQKIGKALINKAGNTPIDIVLFIDGSESMENKISELSKHLGNWIRDWDNSLIDYQIGVVRFRARGAVNIVNVYNPSQSFEQIKKIIELPCQQDENLLEAISEGMQRIKLRDEANVQIILITDEPIRKNTSAAGIIQYLEETHVTVNVLGVYDDFQQEVARKTGGIWVPMPNGHSTNNNFW